MITEQDLREAIAECEGERNPNANTCMKLAAFYTIREHLFGQPQSTASYSYAAEPDVYQSDTEFYNEAKNLDYSGLFRIMDELMSALAVVQPRLYASVIRKIKSPGQ